MTAARRPIAIVVSRFPLVTETFILRELIELERQGQPVVLVPLIRERPEVVHEEARPWIRRALYTPYLSWEIVRANLRALRAQPRRYAALLAKLAGGTIGHPITLIKTLLLWPKSVFLAERLAGAGVRHVHAHFATHPATAAFIASHLTGCDYSVTVHAHDLFVERTLLAAKAHRAAFVRCISAFNRDFLLERIPDLPPDKVHVIHVGVPRVDVTTAPDPPHDSAPVVLCVAALKPYKGIPYLLDACRLLAEQQVRFRCRIIGGGPLQASLERHVRRLGLEDRVQFDGAKPQHAVVRAIADATVMVHPSIVAATGQMDGIPVALMEAMAAGRPVIASELSGIPELVEHERSGLLVPPADAAGLAAAIARILDDPAFAARLGRAGAASVRRAFDLRGTVAQLLARIDPLNPPIALPAAIAAARVERATATPDAELIELSAGTPETAWLLKRHTRRVHDGRDAADRARTEYDALTLVDRARAAEPARWSGLAAPTPVALDIDQASILMTACRGTRLDDLIRDARSGDANAFQRARHGVDRAGTWLRLFHASEAVDDGGDAVSSLLRRAGRDLERCLRNGVLPRRADAALDVMDRLAAAISGRARQSVLAHGDFWPGNVIVGDDVSVVDFEAAHRGLRYEDASYFLIHLDLYFWRPWARAHRDALMAAFLRGFAGRAVIDSAALQLGRMAAALRALGNSTHREPFPAGALRRRLFQSIVLDRSAADRTRWRRWNLAEAG